MTLANHNIPINIDFKIENWHFKIDIIDFKIEYLKLREIDADFDIKTNLFEQYFKPLKTMFSKLHIS